MQLTHAVEITEEQRQMTLLALAKLSLERPGWLVALRETAERFPGGGAMFDEFRSIEDRP